MHPPPSSFLNDKRSKGHNSWKQSHLYTALVERRISLTSKAFQESSTWEINSSFSLNLYFGPGLYRSTARPRDTRPLFRSALQFLIRFIF